MTEIITEHIELEHELGGRRRIADAIPGVDKSYR